MVQGADPREGATQVTTLFLFIFCSSHLLKGHESKELDIALNEIRNHLFIQPFLLSSWNPVCELDTLPTSGCMAQVSLLLPHNP